ncbi:MAG: hypothetical protein F6K65_17025 [Moorea sp. SIO3C2]|nr:hypothetical protein [Moorena sp. SIO3C2]
MVLPHSFVEEPENFYSIAFRDRSISSSDRSVFFVLQIKVQNLFPDPKFPAPKAPPMAHGLSLYSPKPRTLYLTKLKNPLAMQRGLGGFPHERLHQEGFLNEM